MLKRFLFTLFFAGLLVTGIVACQSQTTEVVQVTRQPTATATTAPEEKTPTATATKAPTTTPTTAPTITSTPTSATTKDDSTPTANPTQTEKGQDTPLPTPTRPWQIPEEREDDWTKGGENAGLILVEYGDYQ